MGATNTPTLHPPPEGKKLLKFWSIEARYALFDYFIDIRYSLKGRLPQHILLSKAKQLYEEYCVLKTKAGESLRK